jgi:hypothetical protein
VIKEINILAPNTFTGTNNYYLLHPCLALSFIIPPINFKLCRKINVRRHEQATKGVFESVLEPPGPCGASCLMFYIFIKFPQKIPDLQQFWFQWLLAIK